MAGATRLNQTRDMAAARGTAAHNSAEYVLKTAQRLARATAQPNATAGSLEKMAYIEHQKRSRNGPWNVPFKAPRVFPWSASPALPEGLRGWILDHVTSIHAVEFSAFTLQDLLERLMHCFDIDGIWPLV